MATVTFFSNATGHELVRQPKNDKPVPTGAGWMNDTPGVRYKFQPAIDESGRMVGRLDAIAGKDVLKYELQGWLAPDQAQGVERDMVAALRAHKMLGRDFWEMPTPAKVVRGLIRKFSVALASDELEKLIASERETFNRAELILEAEDGLKLVRETQDELRAAQEALETSGPQGDDPDGTPPTTPAPKAKAKPKAAE